MKNKNTSVEINKMDKKESQMKQREEKEKAATMVWSKTVRENRRKKNFKQNCTNRTVQTNYYTQRCFGCLEFHCLLSKSKIYNKQNRLCSFNPSSIQLN